MITETNSGEEQLIPMATTYEKSNVVDFDFDNFSKKLDLLNNKRFDR